MSVIFPLLCNPFLSRHLGRANLIPEHLIFHLSGFMNGKFCCMVLRINIDCNGCFRKVQRALLQIRELDTHLIEEKQCRVIVCGKFVPQDVAITLRKKTNRRVEILDIQELRPGQENEEEDSGEDARISVPKWGPVPN